MSDKFKWSNPFYQIKKHLDLHNKIKYISKQALQTLLRTRVNSFLDSADIIVIS